LYVKPTC